MAPGWTAALRARETDDSPRAPRDRDDELPRLRPCLLCRGQGLMRIVPDRRRPQQIEVRPCIVCRGSGHVLVPRPRDADD